MTALPFSAISYDSETSTPDIAVLTDRAGALLRPLPPMDEPETLPTVVDPVDEPFVVLAHSRILTLDTYRLSKFWNSAGGGTMMRAGTADRLVAAAQALPNRFGLAVFDAWRSLALQTEIYESAYADPTLPAGFVSVPSADPLNPAPHATGGTVDVTLTFEGQPLALGTSFDDFSDRAQADAFEGDHESKADALSRDLRRMLYWAMRSQDFVVHAMEWWHFEYGTPRWAALTGQAPIYSGVFQLPQAHADLRAA